MFIPKHFLGFLLLFLLPAVFSVCVVDGFVDVAIVVVETVVIFNVVSVVFVGAIVVSVVVVGVVVDVFVVVSVVDRKSVV